MHGVCASHADGSGTRLIASTAIDPALRTASLANQVARLEPFGSAAPGAPIPFGLLSSHGVLRPRPTVFTVDDYGFYDATSITLPYAFKARLRARVRSASTSPDTEITLAFAIDGIPFTSATVVRASANPAEAVTIELESDVANVLTIRNGSPTHVQTIERGLVRLWPSGLG